MQILVDGDAFPRAVQAVLFRAVERLDLPLVLVASKYLRLHDSERISTIRVPAGPDAADDRIVELARPGDLVITADIPLADRIIERGGHVITPRGERYTEANIKQRLATRNLLDELRNEGTVTGGPASFSQRDVQQFADQLDRFLTKHADDRRNG